MLTAYLIYVFLVVASGVLGLLIHPEKRVARFVPALGISLCSFGALVLLLSTFGRLRSDLLMRVMTWQLPFADLVVGLDPLSGFFLIPLLILAGCCSLYGPRYFNTHPAERSHWFFYALLIAGMVMVLLARNAVLFLIAWEVMSLSSFFLVITDKKSRLAMRAGWIYFVTAHIGTAFLLALFFLLASLAGSFDFAAWKTLQPTAATADLLFVLALIAFGLKAGFVPFHVWLPLAHPSAPSHVSALMSGIMIKMGIYGILRILTFAGSFHGWWGGLLIGLGAVSGVLGVLFAIGQHDMKRLLAYHSVENIGIILLGIGTGVLGSARGSATIALFGFAGALLHVLNHALFKGLLFLGAGSVISQTGSAEIDRLGGLIKSMPRTAVLFLAASIAICGLPFFNGFVSELMIYIAGIVGAVDVSGPTLPTAGLVGVVALALIGGLAAACFAKVFGVVFLGEARSDPARTCREVPPSMIWSMALLAGACIVIGIASPLVLPYLLGPALMLSGPGTESVVPSVTRLTFTISVIFGVFILAVAGITGLFHLVSRKRRRDISTTVTWDCGYIRPAPSMQYTASSFADPIIRYFKVPLAAHKRVSSDGQFFPGGPWTCHSGVEDWFLGRLYTPAVELIDRLFESLRWFQNGKTGQYVLYIALTVLCLILWRFFL